MILGEIVEPASRAEWRRWLARHHANRREVWVRRFLRGSGRKSLEYDELVEECLCFGWIDSVMKKLDAESNVQRVTPRRKKGSCLSELNRQRVWKLQHLGRMTPAGIGPIAVAIGAPGDAWDLPSWVRDAIRADAAAWRRLPELPELYLRLKVGWITEPRGAAREPERQKRLAHFLKMTAAGRRYGAEPLAGLLYPAPGAPTSVRARSPRTTPRDNAQSTGSRAPRGTARRRP